MNWEVHPDVLDREKAKADAQELIDYVRPPLRKLVNCMTHAYHECASAPGIEHFALLHSYRNIMEMLDGIDAFFAEAVWDPAQMLVRSAFENWLNIIYLTEENQEQRGLCYLFVEIASYIDTLKMYIYEHNKRSLRKTLGREGMARLLDRIDDQHRDDVIDTILQHERFLREPIFADLSRLYNSLKPKQRNNVRRYSLIGGPSSIQKLAEKCGYKAMYLTLYHEWSSVAHGSDMRRTFITAHSVRPLRQPKRKDDPYKLTRFALLFGTEATLRLLATLRPGEDEPFWNWCNKEFSAFFERK